MQQTITAKIPTPENSGIGTPCLICGETVRIAHYRDAPKICNKCKEAVLKMRSYLVSNPSEPHEEIEPTEDID